MCPFLEDDCFGQVSGSMPLMNVVFLLSVLQIIGMIGMPPTAPTPRRVQLRIDFIEEETIDGELRFNPAENEPWEEEIPFGYLFFELP